MSSEEDREITAELIPSELARPAQAKRTPSVIVRTTFGAKTDLGLVRENNEDKFDFMEPEDPELLATRGCVYAVADGMGGHAAGQIAAEMALKTLFRSYYAPSGRPPDEALVTGFSAANAAVYDAASAIPGRSGMGCTLTALAIVEDRFYVAHVGDSRAYLIRAETITQLTQDHSWVAEQVRRGAMSPEDAEKSPFRNVITRSIGTSPSVETEVMTDTVQSGDLFLLCSDGLSSMVSQDAILRIARPDCSPSFSAAQLIDEANAHGGHDNITVVIVRVDAISKRRWWRRL
ncbi:MAG: Stp1/IreP family PP2C-type Ser/Thr phosphatase [Armatimonadota bacterium]